MQSVKSQLQTAILAVLRSAREAELQGLSRTALVKLAYLLDCEYAAEHSGQTLSGCGWYFHHFGPFAADLVDGLDSLSQVGMIQSREGELRNRDFTFFWIGEYPQGPSLTEVGLSANAAARFSKLMRRLAPDLSKLLDYVYFKTLPMSGAQPGSVLNFALSADEAVTVSHHHAHVRDQAKIFRMMELTNTLKDRYVNEKSTGAAIAAHRPIYDTEYLRAFAAMDREDEVAPINFVAQLG